MTFAPFPHHDEDAQYRKLVDGITEYAIYLVSVDGTVSSWNSGAERLKGYRSDEIVGRKFGIFYSPEDQKRGSPQKSLETARRDGRFEAQGWRYRKDGSRFWAHVVIDTIREGGEIVGFAKITRDATSIRQFQLQLEEAAAEARAANEAKSAFLAMMSHEIRTPLNGVLGMAQAISRDELSDVQRSRLLVLQESGQILMSILNDILDISKIEAGQLEIEMTEFDLDDILRGAQATFTTIANEKGLSLAFQVEAASGIYKGDATRLRQIVYNILSNAIKFTSKGQIAVEAHRTTDGLSIQISDTGIGMSKATISKLFKKFAQADAATTRQYGGTGLGLAICSELATLMGGTIRVESALGQGSTFEVELPFAYLGAPRAPCKPAPNRTDLAPQITLRVLVAEDNAINQFVLKTLMSQIGIDPSVVPDGEQAVEAWRASEWDIILMDIQMPRMDGRTAAAEIRRLEAETGRNRTPIYALSANAMAHHLADYIDIGMDGLVAKPIQIEDLFNVLETVSTTKASDSGR